MRINGLTPQQYRVACLVADGLTDKAIATALGIDHDTVSFHVRRIVVAWRLDSTKNVRVEIARRVPKARPQPAA